MKTKKVLNLKLKDDKESVLSLNDVEGMEYDIVGDYDDEKGEYLYLLKIGDKEYQYRGIDKQKRMLSDEKKLKGKGIYKMWKPTPMTIV
jgi:hypothetical protein